MKLKINKDIIDIKEIRTDSRKVKKGDLFIAYKGVKTNGHDYILSAIKNGAGYIVYEKEVVDTNLLKDFPNVKFYKVDDGRQSWADLEAQKYGYPQKKLKIVGITGTDGKTTTVNFIYNILKTAGKKVGLISTVSAKYGDKDIGTGLHTTTPDPDILFKILNDMVKNDIEYVILESTSQGLAQKRVYGITFTACGITNVTPEHLDYHLTYENLIRDKALIFKQSKSVFLNFEGKGYNELLKYVPKAIADNQKFYSVTSDNIKKEFLTDLFIKTFPGGYNRQNSALAFFICKYLGIDEEICYKGLNLSKGVKGRFQKIKNNKGINIIIDFAHTPNSMKQVLKAVSRLKTPDSKIITVFGCAGERDHIKRPEMGKISSDYSDIVIVTSEDPRSEDPDEIAMDILKGNPSYDYMVITDREEAILKAIRLANSKDWILILGKGHEESMNIKGTEYPWSDKKAVLKALN